MFGQHDDKKDEANNDIAYPATPSEDMAQAPTNLGGLDDAADDSAGSSPVDTPLPATEPTPAADLNFIATDQKGAPDAAATASLPSGASDLLDIKKSALQQLTPLVGHLNQSAEEKFRTTMMLIQATDDQTLIPTAYDAAKEITDEKTRAQALLDIVNEINYFTTQHES